MASGLTAFDTPTPPHPKKELQVGPLSREFLWIFSSNLPGNFALKNGKDFWVNFSGLRFPRKRSTRTPQKNRGKFGAKFGRKIRKIRGTCVLQLFWPKELGQATGAGKTNVYPPPLEDDPSVLTSVGPLENPNPEAAKYTK